MAYNDGTNGSSEYYRYGHNAELDLYDFFHCDHETIPFRCQLIHVHPTKRGSISGLLLFSSYWGYGQAVILFLASHWCFECVVLDSDVLYDV